MDNKLLILDYSSKDFDQQRLLLPDTNYESVMYVCRNHSSQDLDDTCDRLNLTDDFSEWLWSHPEHEGNSTPVPVLIQQPRKILTQLRKKVGYYDE